jgi:hypothetical protein
MGVRRKAATAATPTINIYWVRSVKEFASIETP